MSSNIKQNDDGTINPIDLSKPSEYSTAPQSIDDKLKAILKALQPYDSQNEEAIAAIKQVFEEAKYVKVDGNIINVLKALGYLDSDVMTGQEWYNRYRFEMKHEGYYSDDLPCMVVARRAAGLDKHTEGTDLPTEGSETPSGESDAPRDTEV